MFEARAGDRDLQGVDILRFAEDGLIRELIVMVRPMSGDARPRRGDEEDARGGRSRLA